MINTPGGGGYGKIEWFEYEIKKNINSFIFELLLYNFPLIKHTISETFCHRYIFLFLFMIFLLDNSPSKWCHWIFMMDRI